jgi:hypothetical protein
MGVDKRGVVHFRNIRVSAPDGAVLCDGLPDLSSPPQSTGELDVLPESPDADPSIGADTDTGFIPLFNGKDLSGWNTDAKGQNVWTVQHGVLTGKGPAPRFLFTDRADFENVHVRAKARINDGGNSSVFMRWGGLGQEPGYEAQIEPEPFTMGDSFLRRRARRPLWPGQWSFETIIADGSHLTVLVNGKQASEFDHPNRSASRGRIGLQMQDPQTRFEFASVEVKGLPNTNAMNWDFLCVRAWLVTILARKC